MRPSKHYWRPNDGGRPLAYEIALTLEARLVAYEDRTLVAGVDREEWSMRAAGREARRRHLVRGHRRQESEASRIEAPVDLHAFAQQATQGAMAGSVAVRTRFD